MFIIYDKYLPKPTYVYKYNPTTVAYMYLYYLHFVIR